MVRRSIQLGFVFALLLVSAQAGSAQACGFIYAKFIVQDSSGKFVDSAKLQLLRKDSDESIIYAEKELSELRAEAAYLLVRDLGGSQPGTRLVIEHEDFETFEDVVDLPLNTLQTQHAFTIVLKRRGSREVASLEQMAVLTGETRGRRGERLAKVLIEFQGPGGSIKAKSNEDGIFSVHLRQGDYSVTAHNGETDQYVHITHMLLKPGYNSRDIEF